MQACWLLPVSLRALTVKAVKEVSNSWHGYTFDYVCANIYIFQFFSLGPLVCKVKDHQVEFIVDTLCNNMIGDNEQLRDISSIGLKTVINELPLTTQTLAATGLFLLICLFIRVTFKTKKQ